MNNFCKYLLIGVAIFIVAIIVFCPMSHAGIETGVVVDGSKYSDEPIEIKIDKSGSKNYYSIDNTLGAKNKIITKENKDYYEINHYLKEDGTIIELIYPNGKQNNADKNLAIVNGSEVKQPRIYGKDGITHLTIVYDEYLHSEETVNFNNPIGDRYTSITNNLGRGDSWSNNGALFNNQISGLEFVMGENGNYTFKYWIDNFGEVVNSFNILWLNGAVRNYNFTAVYDFTPNPESENETVPIDNSTENETVDNNTIIDNTTDNNDTDTVKPVNNETSNPITDSSVTNTEKTTNTDIVNSKNTSISTKLSEHETGVGFAVASIGALILLALTLIGLRDDW